MDLTIFLCYCMTLACELSRSFAHFSAMAQSNLPPKEAIGAELAARSCVDRACGIFAAMAMALDEPDSDELADQLAAISKPSISTIEPVHLVDLLGQPLH